ncbi:hypothetical protein D3C73_1506270 [compost metagenome]
MITKRFPVSAQITHLLQQDIVTVRVMDEGSGLIDQHGISAAIVVKSAQRLRNLLRRDISTCHTDQLPGFIQDGGADTDYHFA